MRQIIVLIFALMAPLITNSQDYRDIIKEGDALFAEGENRQAWLKYNAARAADFENKASVEILRKLTKVYDKIDSIKLAAEEAAEQIKIKNEELEETNNQLKEAKRIAEAERNKAVAAQKIAETEAAKTKATYHAFLAEEYIKKIQYDSAFKYAHLAKSTIDTFKVTPTLAPIYETFGKAVYYTKRDTISRNDFPVEKVLFSKNGNYLLAYGQKKKRYEAVLADKSGMVIKKIKHKKPILSANIAPSEDKILTCSADGTAKVYDLVKDTTITFKEHSDEIIGGTFSEDGQFIATWSRDDTTLLWKPSGILINSLGKHRGNIYDVAFSPNETYIATRSSDQTVNLWDEDGNFLHLLNQHTSYIYHIEFSPDSKFLLTCSGDKTARLWNMQGQSIAALPHSDIVRWGTFSKDGNKILTITQDNKVTAWVRNDTFKKFRAFVHETPIKEAWFSKDENEILVCDGSKYFSIWNISTGKKQQLEKHTDELLSARFCKSGRYILTHSRDKKAKLWCAKDGIVLMEMEHQSVIPPQFTPDGQFIIASSEASVLEKIPLPANVYSSE